MTNNILFDLDGTLTDPKLGIVGSVLYALDKMGCERPGFEELDWVIGPPLHQSFGKLLQTEDPAEMMRAVAFYRERFGDVGMFENRVYDGIEAVLDGLHAEGYSLFIATSKPKFYADKILDHFRLSKYFIQLYGSNLDGSRSNKAEVIEDLLNEQKVSPATALMIGDREHDVLGALHHEIPCLGVLYGYGSRDELVRAGARALVETPSEITEQIAQWSRL